MADWQKFNFKGGPHLPTPLRSFLNFLRQFHLALYRNISRFFKYFFQIYIHYIYFFTFLSAGRILGTEGTKYEVFIFTGCLNLLCPTSNQDFFRLKWHSKQKALIFGILSWGDLCLIHDFFIIILYSASTASDLHGVKIQVIWSHAASNLTLFLKYVFCFSRHEHFMLRAVDIR